MRRHYFIFAIIIAVLPMLFIGCSGKYSKSSEQGKQRRGLDLDKCDSYRVHLNYKQEIEGYQVTADFYPSYYVCRR